MLIAILIVITNQFSIGEYHLKTIVINPKKRVHYGPMNPEESREVFIRQALVAGEFHCQAPFFRHNRQLLAELEELPRDF